MHRLLHSPSLNVESSLLAVVQNITGKKNRLSSVPVNGSRPVERSFSYLQSQVNSLGLIPVSQSSHFSSPVWCTVSVDLEGIWKIKQSK